MVKYSPLWFVFVAIFSGILFLILLNYFLIKLVKLQKYRKLIIVLSTIIGLIWIAMWILSAFTGRMGF